MSGSGLSRAMGHFVRFLYYRGYLSEFVDIDALTGVYNRNYFERLFSRTVFAAQRSEIDLVVVSVDVDDLKKQNDVYGHGAGDKLIKSVAKLFLRSVRKSDQVIRMGGDEFLLILWNCKMAGAEKLMDRIVKKASEKEISFSYGLALAEKGKHMKERIKEADEKMYTMKVTNKA